MSDTMKAVRIHEFGGPEVLVYEDAPKPVAGPGEALIRVRGAGINPVDWKVREGWTESIWPHQLPLILGWDVAGVIEAVGAGVSNVKPGDEVYADTNILKDGAYAEYVLVEAKVVALKPKSLSFVEAASLPIAALTAWQALFDAAGLQPGQTVLIHAAAGGVGSLGVQFAKWKGARVIGTASARNHAFLKELGADELIDYTAERFEDSVKDVDVVFDTVGKEVMQRSWQTLKPGGYLVGIVNDPDTEQAKKYGVRASHIFGLPRADDLTAIAELIDAGTVRPVVSETLPLSEARRAHEESQGGHVRGKIVLEVP
ncbi:MAG TPA: NADP-dependent oxidoreductase [Armatimonadaceae bacterium]|nr:NADP-dependent oxidoreductase [Armatimonadaceae bacterium]